MALMLMEQLDNSGWTTISNNFPNCKYKVIDGVAYVVINCNTTEAPQGTWTTIGTFPKHSGLSANTYLPASDNNVTLAAIQVRTNGQIRVHGGSNGGGCFALLSYPTI